MKELAIFTLIASLLGGYLLAPLPLPGARNHWAPTILLNAPEPIVSSIRHLVGNEASVSVQENVGAHFSQRQQIFQYPKKVGEVDAIILRLASPTRNIAWNNSYPAEFQKCIAGSLDAHLQMNRQEYIQSIERMLRDREYRVLLWQDPWLVLSRNGRYNLDLDGIKKKLAKLKAKWKIGSGTDIGK